MPALKVNIIIVHPRGVVFQRAFTTPLPSGIQHPAGEQL
jgi:hypothetical protein